MEGEDKQEDRWTLRSRRKKLFFLPCFLTLIGLSSGFLSVMSSASGKFNFSIDFIVVAAVIDALDGKIARLTNTQTEFGFQLDSLADLIAFGVAPAFLYFQYFHMTGKYKLLPLFFVVAMALRLARFNSEQDSTLSAFFNGLPSPGGALSATAFLFFCKDHDIFLTPPLPALLLFFISCLVISKVKYIAFAKYDFKRPTPFRLFTIFITAVFIALFWFSEFAVGFSILYLMSGLFLGKKMFVSYCERHEIDRA